jgi:alpha-L-fucosidase
VTTNQVRIRITGSRLEPTLAEVGLFKQAKQLQAPIISERDSNGSVTIECAKNLPVVYTTDGTVPNFNSTKYRAPVSFPRGGTVQAGCVASDGQTGMITSRYFAGLTPIGWKVVTEDSAQIGSAAANAIDGNQTTIWQTCSDTALPHQLTVDMGSSKKISGFVYLPRQDRNHDGVVDVYRFETSTDGLHWITNVKQERFSNIENNPVLQEVTFAPIDARFFRFTAMKVLGTSNCMSAAEVSVLSAEADGHR